MSFLIPELPKNKSAYVKKAEQKTEYKLIGSMRRIRGLHIFEYHTEEETLIQLECEKIVTIDIDKKVTKHTKVHYRPKCWYFQAHNVSAAQKKIYKLTKQIKNVQNK